jgi:predicted ATPase/DNA-binding winged helix-turn-helix (wHTH) protein
MHEGFRFGYHYKLLPAERLLLSRGEPVNLAGRAFDVLVALVRRRGRLVSKNELLDEVWADLVVEENNLAVHVAALRKLLGPDAVSTITGVGYRFAWEVFPVDGAEESPARGEGPSVRGNLPMRLPKLLGRNEERADIRARLREGCPLLTICGEAGIGKTLLAQTLAQDEIPQHRDGVFWIELAPIQDATRVPYVIAAALQIPLREAEPAAELVRALKPLSILLVLDNAEHLVDAVAAVVQAILRGTSDVALLCTSQVPLKVPQEHVYRLDPLAVPPAGAEGDDPLAYTAVQLFVERATAADRHFVATPPMLRQVGNICRSLDGNSLAIELAAARVGPIGVSGLEAHLGDRLALLSPVRAEDRSRRNALAAAIDWSYALLSNEEKKVFRRLGVFRGGFALDGAALCVSDASLEPTRAAGVIGELVDRSLVVRQRSDRSRLDLLETGRLYALARLAESNEANAARAQHCASVRWLLDEAFQEFWQAPEESWRPRYEPELDNIRAALEWGAEHDAEAAIGLFGSAWPLSWTLPTRGEMQAWSHRLEALVTAALPVPLRARFREAMCFAHSVDFPEQARNAARLASDLYAEAGDRCGQYRCLMEYAFNWRVDDTKAREAVAAARAIEDGAWPPWILERGRTAEAVLEMGCGRFDEARLLYGAGLELSQRANYQRGVRRGLSNLADLELAAGNVDEAVRLGHVLRGLPSSHGPGCITALMNFASALIVKGDLVLAREVAQEAYHEARRFDLSTMWSGLDALALLVALEGRHTDAARIARAADAELKKRGQHKRQPNEARERAQVGTLLAQEPAVLAILHMPSGGEALRLDGVLQIAFGLPLRGSDDGDHDRNKSRNI